MKIREHVAGPDGRWCIFCGAWKTAAGMWDENATCRERDNGVGAEEMRPEPRRRIPACEDADTISARLAELQQERAAALNQTPPALDFGC